MSFVSGFMNGVAVILLSAGLAVALESGETTRMAVAQAFMLGAVVGAMIIRWAARQ